MAHQEEDVRRLSAHPRVLVFNGLGTGKTATVAWWLHSLWVRGAVDRVVIVGPSMVFTGWRETMCGGAWDARLVEFEDCRPPNHKSVVESLVSGGVPSPGRLLAQFTTYGGLTAIVDPRLGYHPRWSDPELPAALSGSRVALVVDEAHCAALHRAAQSEAVYRFADRCVAVAAVTATPIGRWEHLRLWGLLRIVRPDVLRARPGVSVMGDEPPRPGTFDAFKSRYGVLKDPMSSKGKRFRVRRAYATGVKVGRVKEEVLEVAKPFTVRRSKEECLDLPPKVRLVRSYRETPDISRLMRGLIDDDRAVLESGHAVVPDNVLEERLRVLELTGGWLEGRPVHCEKLQLLADVSTDLPDGPVLCWASRTREMAACALIMAGVAPGKAQHMASQACPPDSPVSAEAYSECLDRALAGGVGVISGRTPGQARDRIQDAWRSGSLRCVVAHPGVAGAGLNWQHVVSTVYYSPCLGSISRQQSEDRVHRHGLRHTAVYIDLVMESGPDQAASDAHRSQIDAELSVLKWLRDRLDADTTDRR